MTDLITRRRFLGSAAALAVAPPMLSRASLAAPIPVRGLNNMTLAVSDTRRSLEFYQGLFGMPIQTRQGSTPCLRIGDGPQFMALAERGANARAQIEHLGLTVEGFDAERLRQVLEDQEAWIGHEGTADGQHLLLSAGQLITPVPKARGKRRDIVTDLFQP